MPENVDPPTPDELANASNKLGDPQAGAPEPSERSQKWREARKKLEALYAEVKVLVQDDKFNEARVILNKCWFLEDQIKTLGRFKDDEEFRLHLITVMSNGYR